MAKRGDPHSANTNWPITISPCMFPIDAGMGLQHPPVAVMPVDHMVLVHMWLAEDYDSTGGYAPNCHIYGTDQAAVEDGFTQKDCDNARANPGDAHPVNLRGGGGFGVLRAITIQKAEDK